MKNYGYVEVHDMDTQTIVDQLQQLEDRIKNIRDGLANVFDHLGHANMYVANLDEDGNERDLGTWPEELTVDQNHLVTHLAAASSAVTHARTMLNGLFNESEIFRLREAVRNLGARESDKAAE